MFMVRLPILLVLLAVASLGAESPAEQKVLDAIKSPELTVVHLWAPWCSNCQAELKSGGWSKIVNENPNVKFYFVSVWNDGQDGRALWRKQDQTIHRLAALLDPDDLDLQRRRSPLRIKLRRSPFSCAPTISRRQPVGMVA